MNIIFFKICNDENEYKKIQHDKRIEKLNKLKEKLEDNKSRKVSKEIEKYKLIEQFKKIENRAIEFINEKTNHYKFCFITKYNLIERIEENNRLMYVIYVENEKGERDKNKERADKQEEAKEQEEKNRKERQEMKILQKINREILKVKSRREYENINLNKSLNRGLKIVLSKQIKELIKKHKEEKNIEELKKILQDSLYSKELYIETIEEVVKNVIKLRNEVPEEQSMYVLLNSNNGQYKQLINNIIANYKMLNIVTKNYNQFKAMEENAEENLEAVSVLNNKRKSLARAKYIINIDFRNEELIEYYINRTAIIFNISRERTIKLNNFDGIVINNINTYKQEDEFDLKDYYIEDKVHLENIIKDIECDQYEVEGNNASIQALSAISKNKCK